MPQITLDIPQAFIDRFVATLPEGTTPLEGLKGVVKGHVVAYELGRYNEEVKAAKIAEIRSAVEAKSVELSSELEI